MLDRQDPVWVFSQFHKDEKSGIARVELGDELVDRLLGFGVLSQDVGQI